MATRSGSEDWACEVFKRFCAVAAIEADPTSIKKSPPDGKKTDIRCRIGLEDHWFEFCECIDGNLADDLDLALASLKAGGPGIGAGVWVDPIASFKPTIEKHLAKAYPDSGPHRSLLAYFERQGPHAFDVGFIRAHLDPIIKSHLQPAGRWMSVWLYSDWAPGTVLADWQAPTSLFHKRAN